MSDKILNEAELENQVQKEDQAKEDAIQKHASDLEVMNKLAIALDEYLIKFGRTSNIHDQCLDLQAQVLENRRHLVEWIAKIC